MRLLILLFSLLLLTTTLFAADDANCSSSNYFQDTTNATTANITFKKRCLPNKDNDLKEFLNIRGGMYLIGNQVMCEGNGTAGYCKDPGANRQNNSVSNTEMIMADYDDNASTISVTESAKTTTSTMAKLTLEPNDSVLYARLFWMGRYTSSANASYVNNKTIKFLSPSTSNAYTNINCTAYGYNLSSDDAYYCSADITDYTKLSGDYWVGDVNGTDNGGQFAAWAISILYTNNSKAYKNITVYEGFNTFYSGGTPLSIPVEGFLTPREGNFSSRLHIFSGESDDGYGDYLEINKKDGTPTKLLNPINNKDYDLLNASISTLGVINKNRLPDYNNSLGIDIDTIELVDENNTQIIDNNQTSTILKFTSTQDRLYLPFIALETELYVPNLCYDYGYSQDNRSFTKDNNGSEYPTIAGNIIPGKPITLNVYIHNREDGSDIQNVNFFLSDLNTTQLSITGGVRKTNSGELVYSTVPTVDLNATAGDISFALDTTIRAVEGVFTEITLNPIISTLDAPLNMSIDFSLDADGELINYSNFRLDEDIPLCAPAGDYNPAYGIYNVLDRNVNGTIIQGATNLKYNLFTQVANRPIEAKIVAFDTNNTDTVIKANEFMAIEMYNAREFFDINFSCLAPSARVSTTEWFQFGDANTTITDANLTLSNDFYSIARENVGFRVWYFRDDKGNQIFTPNATNVSNVDLDYNVSSSTVCQYPDGYVASAVDVAGACGSRVDLDLIQRESCAACLFGYTANVVCSRDNFAIRPESFDIKISDIDHNKTLNSLDRNNSAIYISDKTPQLAAGYNYRFDVTATSHTRNTPTIGYTKNFIPADNESNSSFLWRPDITKDVSGCNDTDTLSPDFYIANGALSDNNYSQERNLTNVGKYTFDMIDTSWTKVDQAPAHHFDVNGGILTHFDVNGTNYRNDCLPNTSMVPSTSINLTNENVGCNIQSVHTNEDNASLSTNDYNITFVPFRLDLSTFKATYGKNFNTPLEPTLLNNNPMVYMNSLDDAVSFANPLDVNKSIGMSVHYIGDVRPVGEDNNTLSNFVSHCYAEDLVLFVDHNSTAATLNIPQFQSVYIDNNITQSVYDYNITAVLKITPAEYFRKNYEGIIPDMRLHLNFERNTSSPKEIQVLHFGDINATCDTLSHCQSNAKLINNYQAIGSLNEDANLTLNNKAIDVNVTFAYGRTHAPRYRIDGNNGVVSLFYEVYCQQTANCLGYGLTQESVDDVFWYIYPQHTSESLHGDANLTTFTSSGGHVNFFNPAFSFDNAGTKFVQAAYDEGLAQAYPFKTKVSLTPDPWLIYNKYDENATTNNFVIEYYKTSTTWSGSINNSGTVDSNASKTTNRRINW